MTLFIQQIINGIALGSVYALTAIGYSMVYGKQVINKCAGHIHIAVSKVDQLEDAVDHGVSNGR